MSTTHKFDTLQVHGGFTHDSATGAAVPPIYQSSSFVFDSSETAQKLFELDAQGYIYSRLGNPTVDVLEQRIALLEGGVAALAVSSGQSAQLLALATLAERGHNIVSSPFLYGGTHTLFKDSLSRFGIEVRFAKSDRAEDLAPLIDANTRAIYVETISNPHFSVPDFEAIAKLGDANGIPLVVDNTFGAAGYLCRPIAHGAAIVVESATKWIGGHGNSLGGVIVDSGNFNWSNGKFPNIAGASPSYHGLNFWEKFGAVAFIVKVRVEGLRDLGPCLSPFNAFLLLNGVETLSLRAERICSNALALAQWLSNHPKVKSVNYAGLPSHPNYQTAQRYLTNGFGGVLSFVPKGGSAAATAFVDGVKLAKHLANVGDVRTLVIQPSATTHQQLSDGDKQNAGVTEGLIRVSVGIEALEDIIRDFDAAL